MPSLVSGPEYVILLCGGLFAVGVGIGAGIYYLLRR